MLGNMPLGKVLLARFDRAGIFGMNRHSEGRGKALLALPIVSFNVHNAEDKKEAGVGGRSQGQGTRQGLEDPVNLKSHGGPRRA